MTEELVTSETAKLLKDKGMFTDIEFPPQSVAQKWLRETKNIHICIYTTVPVVMDTKYLTLTMELI